MLFCPQHHPDQKTGTVSTCWILGQGSSPDKCVQIAWLHLTPSLESVSTPSTQPRSCWECRMKKLGTPLQGSFQCLLIATPRHAPAQSRPLSRDTASLSATVAAIPPISHSAFSANFPNRVWWPLVLCLSQASQCDNHVCIYTVELLSGPSLALLEIIIWSKFVFFLKHRLPKNTIKIGVSAFFVFGKIARKNFGSYYLVQVGVFLRRTQLGPDNNFQLGPDNNFQKCHFFVSFCFEKCAKMPIFIVFFEK